jgi:hypothetical protein
MDLSRPEIVATSSSSLSVSASLPPRFEDKDRALTTVSLPSLCLSSGASFFFFLPGLDEEPSFLSSSQIFFNLFSSLIRSLLEEDKTHMIRK